MAYFTAKNLLHHGMRDTLMRKLSKIKMSLNPESEKKAAVLIPFCVVNDTVSMLFTLRPPNLKSHGGEISFPGGKIIKGETPIQAALRETEEEIGLQSDKIEIWGCGPVFPGKNKATIIPVISSIDDLTQEDLNVNKNKVADVFAISLESLCNRKHQFHTQYTNGYILPVFEIDGHKIWGITALMIHAVLNSLLPPEVYNNDWTKKKAYRSLKPVQD